MPGLLPDVDPDGLLEYSVVFTDRSLNHMSQRFQRVMRDISGILKHVYNAHVRGRRARRRHLRHGSGRAAVRHRQEVPRHPQRLVQLSLDADLRRRKDSRGIDRAEGAPRRDGQGRAVRAGADRRSRRRRSAQQQPDVVFAPHVETASGIILPDAYLRAVGDAVHAVGGLFVLDCVASGAMWVDMEACGVDVLITAPQKGWSSTPGFALVMLSAAGAHRHRRHDQHQLRRATCASGCRSWRPTKRAAMPITRRCRPIRSTATARHDEGNRALRLREGARRAAGTGQQGARAARAPRLRERRAPKASSRRPSW